MLKKIILLASSVILILSVSGCGGKATTPKPVVIYKNVDKIYLDTNIPVDKFIAENIQSECALGTRLLDSVKIVAEKNNIEVILDGKPNSDENILKLNIIDAVSSGNAFIGHNKFVIASGELFEGDKKIASFKVARRSNGGFFGAYKSSCAVLGGCTATMAKDIIAWLKAPTKDAILGDRRLLRNK
ncbi:hypothetical protein [Sulfurimonas sp.]|uniref:hypothetical protein n=1 Tax=Sulfurimonas sp. TaxID=2022749 RepID=UPI0025FCB1FA|nr:hypothetical protein [Sulfurimonas sp.]